jgi:succinate dehydrogenase/fumarate reductase cytochrome b subunit
MKGVNWERWARACGIAFVVLFVVAFIVYGEPPKVNDSAEKIANFYDDHGGRILTADVLFGFAFVFLLVFIGAIASTLREAGKGGWGAVTIASGAVFLALQAVTGAVVAGLAINIAAVGDEGVVRAVNTLLWTPDAISAFPLATFILAATIGLARIGVGASWYGWIGALAGVLVFLHGTNFASSGFWSPTGGYSFVAIIAGLAWTLITSILLVRMAPAAAAAPERAAVPTT